MKKSFESMINWNRKFLLIVGVMLAVTLIAVMPSQTNAQTTRIIRAVSVATQPGQQVTVSFQLDSQGNEASIAFSVNFNQAILSNPVVALGSGAPNGSSLGTNVNQVANGQIGVLVGSSNAYTQGTRQIITIKFNVAANAPIGLTPITFGSTPTLQSVSSSVGGTILDATYQPGNVQIGSTAAGVEVSGRVLTPDGRGLRNARVTITDANGEKRSATTSSFGYYKFEEVETGTTYVIGVSSKQYRFTSRVLQVTDSLTDFDFVGQE
jgi:hypothetical protein